MNDEAKTEIVKLAIGVVRGEIDMVEGARLLVRRFGKAGLRDDPDAITIIGFESETDDLPVGPQRQYWNPEALAAKDKQREAYISRAGAAVLDACQSLIEKVHPHDVQ